MHCCVCFVVVAAFFFFFLVRHWPLPCLSVKIISLALGQSYKFSAHEKIQKKWAHKSYAFALNYKKTKPKNQKHSSEQVLTHWGQVTHICIGNQTIIGSDNGLSLDQRQAIIWTNAGILLIGPLGINFGEIVIEIYTLSFKKMCLKMSSGKW